MPLGKKTRIVLSVVLYLVLAVLLYASYLFVIVIPRNMERCRGPGKIFSEGVCLEPNEDYVP